MNAFISSRVWLHKALSQYSQYEVKIMCYKHKYIIIHVRDIITWLGVHSSVRPHCFIKLTWKWMRIFALSASLQFLTFSWCIILDSVCLHGHRAALRKAYFVHIAVFLRHGKAYGKHSYAFPGVSDSACQLLYLCVCEHEYFCFMLMSTFCEATGVCPSCLGFSSEHTMCKTCHTSKKHDRSLSVLYRKVTHPPLFHSCLPSNLYEEVWRSWAQTSIGGV